MLKKFTITLSSLALSCNCFITPVLADSINISPTESGLNLETEEFTPFYEDVRTIMYAFSVSDTGVATYKEQVNSRSGTKITVTVDIQQKKGKNWYTVDTLTSTKYENISIFSGQAQVEPGYEYRAFFTTDVTYGNNKHEVITEYKYA